MTFSINPIFDTALRKKAAMRIAQGARIVGRDANPLRSHAITFEHIAKLGPINAVHLQDLITCFTAIICGNQSRGEVNSDGVYGCFRSEVSLHRSPYCTVLGLSESGIIPSFAMKKACESARIDSELCYSSRADTGGRQFSESHSHAPDHFLPSRLPDQLGEELWIVEDEITTGRTIENLIKCIYDSSNISKCRVFSLLDARDTADLERFERSCFRRGWNVTFQSILRPNDSSFLSNQTCGFAKLVEDIARHYVVGESISARRVKKLRPPLKAGDSCTSEI